MFKINACKVILPVAIAVICWNYSSALAEPESWRMTIQVQGQIIGDAVNQDNATLGVETSEDVLPKPPEPVTYTALIKLWRIGFGEGPFHRDVRVHGSDSYCWILEVNPHGNVPPPGDRCATLSWDPAELPDSGTFEFLTGFDCAGVAIVQDMRTTTQYEVCGASAEYFTLQYTPPDDRCNPDNVNPVAICPGDITQGNDPGQCGAVVTFAIDATDNCPGVTVSADPPSGSFFPVGLTMVAVTAVDAAGNTNSCTFGVTVNDTTDPVAQCPADITVGNDPGQCGATISFQAIVDDNCPGATVTCSPPSGSFFNVGTTVVTCTATDAAGNTDVCSFSVTVNDTEAPVASCSGDTTVRVGVGVDSALVEFSTDVTDSCLGASIQCSPTSGSWFPLGATQVTCTATDGAGNTELCSFTVTVEQDTVIPPIASCMDVTVVASDTCWTDASIDDGSFDPDGGSVRLEQIPPGPYPIGDTWVTLLVTDDEGDTASCPAIVTVEDITAPQILCPADMVVENDPGQCGAVVSFLIEVEDNCGSGCADAVWVIDGSGSMGDDQVAIANNAALFFEGLGGGDFRLGVLAYTDIANPVGIDGVFNPGGPGSGEFTRDRDIFATMVTAVGDIGSGTENGLTALNDALDWYPFREGCRKILILVTDEDADDAAEFNVLVPPLLASGAVIHTIFQIADSAGYSALAPSTGGQQFDITANWGANLATLASQIFAQASCDPPSGSFFPVGTSAVTCVASDVGGNSDTCVFAITVVDSESPIPQCPSDTTIEMLPGSCDTIVEFQSGATDNCLVASFVCNPPSGSVFSVGLTRVSCVATDQIGNRDSCSFLVTVVAVDCGCSICGQVVPGGIIKNGTGLQGVCVQAWTSWPDGEIVSSDTTDSDGQFCLEDLEEGNWDIRVYADGYCTQIIEDVPCDSAGFMVSLDPIPFTEIPAWPFFADYQSTNATVFGVPLMPGDVILATDPGGVYCGYTVVTTPGQFDLHVLGDNPNTPLVDEGAVSGDRITLLLNCVCPIQAGDLWQNQVRFIQDYDFQCNRKTLECELCYPWNWVSFNVIPDISTLETVLSSIDGKYDRVYSGDCILGPLSWEPTGINDLLSLDPYHGFGLRVAEPGLTLTIDGAILPVNTPLELCQGWNFIPYLPDFPDTISHALASIAGLYEQVLGLDCDGGHAWSSSVPSFVNDRYCLGLCHGYWIKMTQDATLVYPVEADECNVAPGDPGLGKAYNVTSRVSITPYFGDLWSVGNPEVTGIWEGDLVTVRTTDGTICGECVAGAEGTFLIHVYGDDPTTAAVEGATEGERLVFEVDGQPARVTSGSGVFAERGSERIALVVESAGAIPSDYVLHQNYPNPFNAGTVIPFTLGRSGDWTLSIFNVAGQLIKAIAGSDMSGRVDVPWNGDDEAGKPVASGIYFYRVVSGDLAATKKMILLK